MTRSNDRPIRPLPLAAFTMHETTLVTDASDLGPDLQASWMSPLFFDAADVGIAIHSHKTGKTCRFFYEGPIQDRSGELQGWRFLPLQADAALCPKVSQVHVYND